MNDETQHISDLPEPAHALVPIDLVHRAITSGADVVVLEKLLALQERWDANQARKAFDNAIAAAKADMPEIKKTSRVDFKSAKGHTQYSYEDLAEIAKSIKKPLGNHGLSYRFRTTSLAPDHIAVTCIISHRDGYSEETTLAGGPDASGNKNSIQAIGSAITYLQRYTLKAALGLAASDDDDGRAAGNKTADETEGEYARRWKELLENSTDDIELETQWDNEADLRRTIVWRDSQRRERIAAAVKTRVAELKKENDKVPDLKTQRYAAEES